METFANIGPNAKVECDAQVVLRRFASISQNVRLCTATLDCEDPAGMVVKAPIEIGENAWVAADAYVGPGVTIGPGAVLGAAGVAFENLAPHTVHVGNPAKAIRPRRRRSATDEQPFDDEAAPSAPSGR